MRLRIRDIQEATKELVYEEPSEELNRSYELGRASDVQFSDPAHVEARYYRVGTDVFVNARVECTVLGTCARCLEEYPIRLERDLSMVFVPGLTSKDLEEAEAAGVETYYGDEIDLLPQIFEALVLALPTAPLCREDCRGLCPRCGTNRNTGSCDCPPVEVDPRLAVLRSLKSSS